LNPRRHRWKSVNNSKFIQFFILARQLLEDPWSFILGFISHIKTQAVVESIAISIRVEATQRRAYRARNSTAPSGKPASAFAAGYTAGGNGS
jgi:hypothetical protein